MNLDQYAGTEILVRFNYDYVGGPAFTGTNTHVGWLVDDIQIAPTFTPRRYTEVGEPSPAEILSVELVNRARSDAMAEALRLRNDDDPQVLSAIAEFDVDLDELEAQFATLDPEVQPLAINKRLTAAARLHNEDMLSNVFQGHTSSSNPPPPHQPGDGPGARASYQGYRWQQLGENVFAYAFSVWYNHAGFNIDWGPGTWHGMQDPPGHRLAIHEPLYREVGVGMLEDSATSNGQSVGPLLSTQKFSRQLDADHPFIVGVTFMDLDETGFYAEGEGLGGVRVDVEGASFYSISSEHGAFAVPVSGDGTYTVTFSKPGYLTVTQAVTVVNGQNVKVDYLAETDPNAGWVTDLSRGAGDTLKAEFVYGGSASDLAVEVTEDFVTWDPVSATINDMGGGSFELEVDTSPPIGIFRVIHDP